MGQNQLRIEIDGDAGPRTVILQTQDVHRPVLPSMCSVSPRAHISSDETNTLKGVRQLRLQRFAKDSTLSFVPPDGSFVLMDYRANPASIPSTSTTTKPALGLEVVPLILKASIDISEKGGSFIITLTPRSHSTPRTTALEQVVVAFRLDNEAVGAHCTLSYGSGGQGGGMLLRDREKEERIAGTWAWEPKEKVRLHVRPWTTNDTDNDYAFARRSGGQYPQRPRPPQRPYGH